MTRRPAGSAEERGHQALIFLERLNTRPDDQTALELRAWMKQSPENEREFIRISTLLHAASLCPPLDEADEPWFRRHAMPLVAGLVAVAVACVVLCIVGVRLVIPVSHRTTALSESFTLKDKSHVRLYGESQIRIAMSKDARLVKLAGNGAAFDVETNPIPFQVNMAGLLITATGTQFNVIRRNQDGRTDIYLKQGKLELSGRKVRPLQMGSGDIAKVHDGGTVEMTRADTARLENVIVDGWTYAQVADAMNRENVAFQIEVRGSVRSMPAGGVVDLTDPKAWLALLPHSGLRVTPDADVWIVEPGPE